MAPYVVLALIALIGVAGVLVHRLLADDGGPRSEPMPTQRSNWHPRLPSHPYATDQ